MYNRTIPTYKYISIAVVVVDEGRFKNVLEIGETAAQVKTLSKDHTW